ncbi:MAG: DUF2892 domain-containing protein [Spirochaeta sp.]|nr:DUF2892 domain-containing protein [Spirochaeta sp.]
MVKNVGGIDKVLRIVFGIGFLGFGIVQGGAWWALAAFGAVLLVTAITGFCGLYTFLKVNTRKDA